MQPLFFMASFASKNIPPFPTIRRTPKASIALTSARLKRVLAVGPAEITVQPDGVF